VNSPVRLDGLYAPCIVCSVFGDDASGCFRDIFGRTWPLKSAFFEGRGVVEGLQRTPRLAERKTTSRFPLTYTAACFQVGSILSSQGFVQQLY